jgi:hypothetical protein
MSGTAKDRNVMLTVFGRYMDAVCYLINLTLPKDQRGERIAR